MNFFRLLIGFAIAAAFAMNTACAPNPRRALSQDERLADFSWLTSKVEANYAPLQYKEEVHDFDYAQLKAAYKSRVEADQTNADFYLLMKQFIGEFKDGHMNLSVNQSGLHGRAQVAYLGFIGYRTGDSFRIKSLLPTIAKDSVYPLKVGDEILEVNAKSLIESVETELLPYRNVGNIEANYTILMPSLFGRVSLNLPLPTEENMTLKIKRSDKEITVVVPWIIEDYSAFSTRQRRAAAKKAIAKGINYEEEEQKAMGLLQIASVFPYLTDSFIENILSSEQATLNVDSIIADMFKVGVASTFELKRERDTYLNLDIFSMISHKFSAENKPKTPMQVLAEDRYIPKLNYPAPNAKTYPAYVTLVTKAEKRHAIGYIHLNSFSPGASTEEVIKEFKSTLRYFRDFGGEGVQGIVIDTINNGGGSLELGLRLAALLSSEEIALPTMKVALNDSWLDSYQSNSEKASDDASKELARRVYNKVLSQFMAGEHLSDLISVHSLFPYRIVPNSDLIVLKKPVQFKTVVLINEMCASMCDIFASTLKDNEMATFVGQKTMGAGGNVVSHFSSPNGSLNVSLTESLVVSSQGVFLENNGIEPDIEMNVSKASSVKYKTVIEKAFDVLIDPQYSSTKVLLSSY